MRPICFVIAILVAAIQPAYSQESSQQVRKLVDQSNWFALRTRVVPEDPLFIRGVVASAFNDAAAAGLLSQAIQSQPKSEDAHDAHLFLALQLLREGRTGAALEHLHSALVMQPDAEDVKAFLSLVEPFRKFPDQKVLQRGHSVLRYSRASTGLQVPVEVNGHPVHFILDTGMPWSGISESQAHALGMTISGGEGVLGDAAGQSDHVRVAQAERLSIGALQLAHVAFLVFRDDQMPFAKLAAGEQGLIGLPVILAMGNVAWDNSGRFEIGRTLPAKVPRVPPNLAFDPPMTHVLVRGTFQGQSVDFELDTGSNDSNLWPPFARQFAERVNAARVHGTKQETGLNGSTRVRFAQLDRVAFSVGGAPLVFSPARVMLDETKDESALRDGAIGMDTLAQVKSVSLDFATMTIALGPASGDQAATSKADTPVSSASK